MTTNRELRANPAQSGPWPQTRQAAPYGGYYGEKEAGLGGIASKLWRRKWLVAGITAAAVIAGGIATSLMDPRYSAASEVLVGVQTPHVLSVESVLTGLNANSETVQSEVYVVTSRAVAEKVARRLELDKEPEFNSALRLPPAFDLSRLLGIDMVKGWFKSSRNKGGGNGAVSPDQRTPEERKWDRVVTTVLGHIYVEPFNRSRVLSIGAESQDPRMASRLANTFADVYLEQQTGRKQEATEEAGQWLNTRIAELKQEVRKSDQAVEDYRRKHGLYETKSDTVIAQQLAELNRELLNAQNAKVDAESKYQQAKSHLQDAESMESLPAVLQSPLIQNLRGQQSELERQSAQLGSMYTEKHPLRRDIAAQIKEIKGKIRAEARRIVDGLSHQAKMAADRHDRVARQMEDLQGKMGQANEETVALQQLQREAQANRNMLVALMQRSQETVGQQNLQVPDARVISKADIPYSPSFPPSTLILVLAGFVGFCGSALLALLLESFDQTFHAREDVEDETGLPVLALVPLAKESPKLRANLRTPFWESIQMLNTRLSLETRMGDAPQSVMFTSAVPREGKTHLSMSYARLLAQEGQRVIFLELDWKRPSLHRFLGQRRRAGLAELLHGYVTPEEAVYRDPDTGMHAIFAGNKRYVMQNRVWVARLRLLLGTLSRHYDVIVLDTAPPSVTPEILHVARLVQSTVFVVRWGSTARRAVIGELRSLVRAGASFAGVVLSQVDLRRYRQYSYNGSHAYHHRRYLVVDAE